MDWIKKPIYFILLTFILVPVFLYTQENSLYNLLLTGSIEELKEACRERGISDKGDMIEVRRRLIDYERERSSINILPDGNALKEKNIILKNADYLKMYKDENGDEILFLFGNVHLIYDNKYIIADIVRINTTKKIVIGRGNIKYTDTVRTYESDSFYYNEASDRGIFFRAKTKLGNFIYRGKNIRKLSGEEKYIGKDVSLTTCEIKDPHYLVKADKLYYYDSYALVKNMKLFFGQDDLVELPYFFKNLKEPSVKTAIYFRKRSGIVVQNSYYPIKRDDNYLLLMGDYYERLGIYTGGRWYDERGSQKTDLLTSLALSKNVYYYDNVSENWSPLGPPSSSNYKISRDIRYHVDVYRMQKWENNQLELSVGWIKDPYYIYDFERRSQQFDVMKLISEAENDYPRKDNGFSWFLRDRYSSGNFSLVVDNRVTYVPQRNLGESLSYLPDYYEYRLYSAVLPMITASYSSDIFKDSSIDLVRGSNYLATGSYNHSYYFDEYGRPSKEAHEGSGISKLDNDYSIANYLLFKYGIGLGFNIQRHLNPTADEELNDNQNTLAYTDLINSITFGSNKLYLKTDYHLKYKIAGSRDYYTYGNFRESLLSFGFYFNFWRIENMSETSYNLKPVYDWNNDRYESINFSVDRFNPLINTTILKPVTNVLIKNTLIYDIACTHFKINNLALDYSSKSINLWGRDFDINWNIAWNHNFLDPIVDSLTSSYTMECQIFPSLNFYVGFLSRNDSIWKYIPAVAKKNGVKSLNPLVDLAKSFNFFNVDDRKESNFKLKEINFGLTHDLHEWELKFDYTGRREISYDKNRYVWNNTYTISIGLKKIKDVNFNTQFYNSR